MTLLKSIDYSLNASLSKRAGRPNFEVDFPPKKATQGKSDARFGISTKNWIIEIRLLLTFGPKTTIVGNVIGPFIVLAIKEKFIKKNQIRKEEVNKEIGYFLINEPSI